MKTKPPKQSHDFIAAYDQYADALFKHIYFRVSDRELARDLLQEAFTRTWAYLSRGNSVDNMRAFLYRSAHNLVVDHYRSKKEESLDELAESGFDPEDVKANSAYTAAEVSLVLDLVDTIPAPYRDVVVMRYVEELSPQEIAEVTGESANTVSVRINRAMAMVRKKLNGQT